MLKLLAGPVGIAMYTFYRQSSWNSCTRMDLESLGLNTHFDTEFIDIFMKIPCESANFCKAAS